MTSTIQAVMPPPTLPFAASAATPLRKGTITVVKIPR